eukprot:2787978-Pleurochrysis_carterae.AAC.1
MSEVFRTYLFAKVRRQLDSSHKAKNFRTRSFSFAAATRHRGTFECGDHRRAEVAAEHEGEERRGWLRLARCIAKTIGNGSRERYGILTVTRKPGLHS